VRDTLRDPGGAWAELPPQPQPTLLDWCHAMLLPDDDDADAMCYRVNHFLFLVMCHKQLDFMSYVSFKLPSITYT
jgi:hypothetical protein